ncbi:ABC transporter, periplasmic substrate-binding protein [Geotalea daltonii FRC-32]|uniref:ABC transporter, periplasmic substrate-binding protein n=1 Tax=Geotalea daltonii (strain DSM 22248 / JCM 15807 / FRC-32) TaxID=316067 RepID=B9M494_GEODF|nr:ABC transporter substrate binding protein [Geotalea daltonii]ACM21549.1 ABC transporter, periplasmic substrate-binding protein [Geotalea daltonii FRC-32]
MKLLLPLILAVFLLLPAQALAAEVLIVQSTRHSGYGEAFKGFRTACTVSSHTIVLEDYSETDIARIVREEQPSLILAIGDSALAALKKIRRIPIISVMALNLSSGNTPANVTGVRMTISPERYITLFKTFQVRKVGILFSQARSGAYIKRARQAAERAGVDLVLREVHNPRQTPLQLSTLKGNVDSLWLLPDATAMTRGTVDAYFLFAMEQAKPIFAFSDVYLAYGAAAALEADRFAMGKQAGEMANRLLGGLAPADIPVEDPRSISLKTNHSVIRKLGMTYSD